VFVCVRYEAALHVQGMNSDGVDIQVVMKTKARFTVQFAPLQLIRFTHQMD